MNKFYFRFLTILLFLPSIILLSTIKTEAAFPSDPENWKCSPYCCDGKDGNKKPRANTAAGEIDNYADACSKPASGQCGGSGRYVGCVGSTCYYPQCIGDPCVQVLEHEKGYRNPAGSCKEYACNPVYKVCKPKAPVGPVCGDSKIDTDEECDPPNNACTYDGSVGTCTSGCKCCTECSVSCPSPLVSTTPVNPPHSLSEYFYDNIDSCTDRNVCTNPQTRYADCYEVLSPQPTVSLVKHPEGVSTYLGFVSTNHTGGGGYETDALGVTKDNTVNDFYPYSSERYPDSNNLFYMEATFTDGDNPIESTYVWFNKSGTKPITPDTIDLDNTATRTDAQYGTNSNESFGFMIHHNPSTGNWTPYVPAIEGNGDYTVDIWKNAQLNSLTEQVGNPETLKTVILIPGETKNSIVAKVLIYSITPSNRGKTIKVKFSVSFKDDSGALPSSRPIEGKYKIWLMANDTFGFTPYDNYEDKADIVKNAVHNKWKTNERIRYYDQWKNNIGASGEEKFWNLNFDKPGVNLSISPNTTSPAGIDINWQFFQDTNPDDLGNEFSDLVINVYKSEDLQIGPLRVSNINNGGGTVDVNTDSMGNYYLESEDEDDDILGSLTKDVNHYLLKVHNGSGNGSATLTLNDVGQGKLKFYVTAFDQGGNINDKYSTELDLRDWLITQGGLLFSKSIDINVNHEPKPETPQNWDLTNLLSKIEHENADLSTELIGHQGFIPDKPYRELINSYVIKGFSTDPIDSYYTTLLERFNRKKGSLNIKELTGVSELDGSLSNFPYDVLDTQIAVVKSTGNFTVADDFNCNRQGVFFVNGDLTINGEIANDKDDKDACIFVVSGNVTINTGNQVSNSMTFAYDEINAYILADKKITINKETGTRYDGLYISGGIHSLNENPESPTEYGVVFKRSLKVGDRLRFPALVVNHHSKYGMLAGRIFGKELIIQSTEVGLKPY